ncbi:hypothetical protein [Pseudobythopirellula maris]|uniref:hypothetical protein n=1 Tax=Pseudobythopirellula maris TaxID=2527991 RepID=UPI0011B64879|nr:hypothetical protein [Pseudobythopirellula maris]
MKTLDARLAHFGYTHEWLRVGVITESGLAAQLSEFEASDDKNKEHYRCAAFLQYIKGLTAVSDSVLNSLLELTDVGSDGCDLRHNRAMELVLGDLLTDQQMTRLLERPNLQEHQCVRRAVDRAIIRLRMHAEGLTDEVFSSVCDLNDQVMQLLVLDRHDLRRNHLEWISQHGHNRALRNRSKTMLQSRKFRSA